MPNLSTSNLTFFDGVVTFVAEYYFFTLAGAVFQIANSLVVKVYAFAFVHHTAHGLAVSRRADSFNSADFFLLTIAGRNHAVF